MEENKFQDLELWMITAFYIESLGNKGIKLKDIVSNLKFHIKKKEQKYEKFSDTIIGNHIRDDVLEWHSKEKGQETPYIFQKNGKTSEWILRVDVWEDWKKYNKDKLELCSKFMDFCKNNNLQDNIAPMQVKNDIGNSTPVSLYEKKKNNDKIYKEKYLPIKESLETNILYQCRNNDIYLLGQLVFDNREYKQLRDYAQFCMQNKRIAGKTDIVLLTALVKLIQKEAEDTLNPWQHIYKKLEVNIVSEEQKKYYEYKLKSIYKNTLKWFNTEKNINLYYANKDNRTMIMLHVFLLKKHLNEYFKNFQENKNLTLDNLVKLINKSNLSEYSKIIVNNSSTEQLESLLGKQIAYLQNKNANLCNIDYFVNELSMYLKSSDKYANRQNYMVLSNKKDTPPYLICKNNELYIHIPTQKIEDEINISVVFADNKKIEKSAYLYNDPINIKIEESCIKNIFEDIKVILNGYVTYIIVGKLYRFFENNGAERLNITSIERNPAILYVKNNIEVKDSDIIREEVNKEYKQYLISLKDRSRHIEINNNLFYLDTIEKSDLELETTKIHYIESLSDVEYSITPPKIIVRGSENMQTATISITRSLTGEFIEFTFDEARKIYLEENNDVIYIFDMDDFEIPNFFEKDNLYKVEYNHKNKKLTKEFVIINNININFEKGLYLNEKEINFSIKSPYETDSAYLISINNDVSHYCYKFDDNQSNYIDRPVKFEIPLQKGKTYSLKVDIPVVTLKLTRNIDNILIKDGKYIYERNLRSEFELKLPNDIELMSTPVLVVDDEHFCFKNDNGKYKIEKDKTIGISYDKPYKKSVKLYIQTKDNEYKIDIGKIYNRPEGNISVYENEDKIVIETKYEYISGYPKINLHINNIEGYNDYTDPWILELPIDKIEIPKRELVENDTYTITTYIDEYAKNILDEIEYTYIPNNRIDKEYLEIDSVITPDKIERNVAYYIINNIEYIGKDVYKGQVNYCKSLLSYKLLCELYFKVHKKDNKYIIIPDGEYNLSYIRSGNGKKWILTSISNVKSNIFKLICK